MASTTGKHKGCVLTFVSSVTLVIKIHCEQGKWEHLLGNKNAYFSFPRIHEQFLYIKQSNSPYFSPAGKCTFLWLFIVFFLNSLRMQFGFYPSTICAIRDVLIHSINVPWPLGCVPSTMFNVCDISENKIVKILSPSWGLNFSEGTPNKYNK